MKEILEKLLKEMEQKEGKQKISQEDKEKYKKLIDDENETIIVVTTGATCIDGKDYKLADLFGQLARGLIKSGISEEQLMMNVELASLDKDDEDFKEKSFETMIKYKKKLEERLEKENE